MPGSPLIDRPHRTGPPAIDLTHGGIVHDRWSEAVLAMEPFVPMDFRRLVVVAPHPDDETLGVGGLIAATSERGGRVVVVSLTDGEAAYAQDGLGELRHRELRDAMARLSLAASVELERWQLPDGGLAGGEDDIADRLAELIEPGDLLVGPLDCDGHPDHDAAGAAVLLAGTGRGIDVASYPVWSWHWHDPETSIISERGRRVSLSRAALAAKLEALEMFVSQTAGSAPVLPDHFVRRFDQPFEVLVRPLGPIPSAG